MSINDDIRDMVIQHQHAFERLKASEVRAMRKLLRDGDALLRAEILRADITEWNHRRFQDLQSSLRQIEAGTSRQAIDALNKTLQGVAAEESRAIGAAIATEFDAAGIPQGAWTFRVPAPDQIWAAAKARPMLLDNTRAEVLEPFIRGIGRTRLRAMDRSIRYSFAVGDTPAVTSRRMLGPNGAFRGTRTSADAIVRTSMNDLSSIARERTYKANPEIIKGYQWVSTLDKRTSDICQDRDGKVWYYTDKDVQTGEPLLPGEVYPPAHANCRSTTVPLTRTWEELGIKAEDISPSTRASMNGQVPASTTYYQWLGRQSAATQREVLGATRYAMFKQGTAITKFHAPSGGLYTLDQLSKRGFTVPPRSAVLRPRGK